jgi:hypothetical protein
MYVHVQVYVYLAISWIKVYDLHSTLWFCTVDYGIDKLSVDYDITYFHCRFYMEVRDSRNFPKKPGL